MGRAVTRVKRSLQLPELIVTNIDNDPDDRASVCCTCFLQLAERFKRYSIKPSLHILRLYSIFAFRIASREAMKEAIKVVVDFI